MLHFSQVIFTYLIILPNFALLFNITKQALNAAFIALRTRANEVIIFFFRRYARVIACEAVL